VLRLLEISAYDINRRAAEIEFYLRKRWSLQNLPLSPPQKFNAVIEGHVLCTGSRIVYILHQKPEEKQTLIEG
jgi:hypothetical protein